MVLILSSKVPNLSIIHYIDQNGQRQACVRWLRLDIFEKIQRKLGLPRQVDVIVFVKECIRATPETPTGDTGPEPDRFTFQRDPNLDWTIVATERNQDGDLVDHSPAAMDLTESRDSQTVSEKLNEILLSKDFCGFEQITSSEDPDQIAEDIHGHCPCQLSHLMNPWDSVSDPLQVSNGQLSFFDFGDPTINTAMVALVNLAMLLSVLLVFSIFFMALH